MSKLVTHKEKISLDDLKELIREAIQYANEKSSREIISIPENATEDQIAQLYKREGNELFRYFKKYSNDPASTAERVYHQHYQQVGQGLFYGRSRQKERMNSGWRYQKLAMTCAQRTGRFDIVSDLGTGKSDFITVIARNDAETRVNLYISVKNRRNTLGGQDWPNAIDALEDMAKRDNKNRQGPYCCVFGITLDKGLRFIRKSDAGEPFSQNTEVWLADFFWPFFANYAYEEIMLAVLDVLIEARKDISVDPESSLILDAPPEVIEAFGEKCREAGLLNESGYFDDPRRLVQFLCGVNHD